MQSAHPRACGRDGSRAQRPGPGLPWPCPRPRPPAPPCAHGFCRVNSSTALLCKYAGKLRPLGFRLQLRVDLGTLVSCLVPSQQQQRPSCSHQPAEAPGGRAAAEGGKLPRAQVKRLPGGSEHDGHTHKAPRNVLGSFRILKSTSGWQCPLSGEFQL